MLALRMALRELRGGLSGLRLLAVCLVLGVAALAGVGSLSDAITTGISDRGQLILGGDIEIAMTQRSATAAERAAFAQAGQVSEVLRLRPELRVADLALAIHHRRASRIFAGDLGDTGNAGRRAAHGHRGSAGEFTADERVDGLDGIEIRRDHFVGHDR